MCCVYSVECIACSVCVCLSLCIIVMLLAYTATITIFISFAVTVVSVRHSNNPAVLTILMGILMRQYNTLYVYLIIHSTPNKYSISEDNHSQQMTH